MTSPVVCYPFVGDTVGGSHISMLPVIQAIKARGFVPLVALHKTGPLARFFVENEIDYVQAPDVHLVDNKSIVGQIYRATRAAPALACFLRQHEVAIVHTNDARMHFTWGPAARVAGCKFVWHQRSAEPSRRLGLYSRLANTVITISDYCRASFAGPMSARAIVIRDPFETKRLAADRFQSRQMLLAELGCTSEAAIVGFVGNLTRQKRPSFFLDIAKALRDRMQGTVRFPMFGEKRASLLSEIEARIDDLGLADAVTLMGPRYPIEPWIAACDVLVAPATAEGLGRTLVEAMLLGTPIVAADDAGHREAIIDGQTGRLIAPDDPVAFAEAVMDLLHDPARREAMTHCATEFAKMEFSSERHLDKLKAVYRGLIGSQ